MRIVKNAVKRNLGLFAGLPRYGKEDLESEMFQLVRENWATYNPWRGAASTFVNKIVQNNLVSLWRKASAEIRTERAVFKLEDTEYTIPPDAFDVVRGKTPTAEELQGICLAARRVFASRGNLQQGRSKYQVDQAIGIAILMLRGRLSLRGCRLLLQTAPDLRRALRLKSVPSHVMLLAMQRMLKRELGNLTSKGEPRTPAYDPENAEPLTPFFGVEKPEPRTLSKKSAISAPAA